MKVLGLAAAFGTALLGGCDAGPGTMMGRQYIPAEFQSNGERIYVTGVSSDGAPITYTGGNMHLQMMGGGCATCHGVDRRGARMMPQFWLSAPPLTRDALFGSHVEADGHGHHESYDEESLKQAIFRGTDPSGRALDENMPRWSMSERDWNDLLAYLRR